MVVEVRYAGGIGYNSWHEVFRDGVQVGKVVRTSDTTYRVLGAYDKPLAHARTSTEARRLAAEVDYPSPEAVYEEKCAIVRPNRKAALDRKFGPTVASLARRMLDGSNEASGELRALFADIDALVDDRFATTLRPRSVTHLEYCHGIGVHWKPEDGECVYPLPPSEAYPDVERPEATA